VIGWMETSQRAKHVEDEVLLLWAPPKAHVKVAVQTAEGGTHEVEVLTKLEKRHFEMILRLDHRQ